VDLREAQLRHLEVATAPNVDVGGPWHHRQVTTVLQYLVIGAVIGLVVFGLAVFVFGRGEQLAPLSPRTSPTELPDKGIAGTDIRKIKFAMALRGYRMSDVDWALERMADEVDRLRQQLAGTSVPAETTPGHDAVLAGAQPLRAATAPDNPAATTPAPTEEGPA
jgi:DivIVA domain-containing protein